MDTLYAIFKSQSEKYRQKTALKVKQEGSYIDISWSEYLENVDFLSMGLIELGVKKENKIALLCENRPEWAYSDLAILSIGAITVPIYPTDTPSKIEYILNDSQAKIIIVSNMEQLKKLLQIRHNLNMLERILIIEGPQKFDDVNILNFWEVLKKYRKEPIPKQALQQLRKGVNEEDLASIIYTSGTTSEPKGVMLTHKNFISNLIAGKKLFQLGSKDTCLSFLPLSHVFERAAGFYFAFSCGVTIAYAENNYTVLENIQEVRPTVICGVPRFFEKAYAKIIETAARSWFLKKIIFFWALRILRKHTRNSKKGSRFLNTQYNIADKLVFSKIRQQFGGRIRFFISGGAPLATEIAEFFCGVGLIILEGYGLTETSPVITVNTLEDFKIGSVGKPIPEVEVKIAEDGEILTKGPNVMKGYYKQLELTKTAIKEGWLYTGDMGYINQDGFLFITDRKKDIIITAGGKNVAPARIENLLRTDRYISEVMVCGDRKKYLVALIAPDFEGLKRYARYKGLGFSSIGQLVKNQKVIEFFKRRINRRQKDLANFEQVKYFTLLDKEFSQETGELTPTLKVKRRIVNEEYKAIIDKMYENV